MQIDQKHYDRFIAKVCPEPNTGCWLWMGALRGDGYGIFYAGERIGAHVFSYRWHKGEIPQGHLVHHRCNVSCCVNPDHLEAATYSKNSIDGWRRRSLPPRIMTLDESCREEMTQANHVIAKFGGINATAKALGRTPSSVQAWKKSGSISPWHWPSVLSAAHETGVPLSREDFVAHLEPNGAAAA